MRKIKVPFKLMGSWVKIKKFFKIKMLFYTLSFLALVKLSLLFVLLGTYVYTLEAKQETTLGSCPPEFTEFLKLERSRLHEKAKELEVKEKELKLLEMRIQEQINVLKELQASVEEKLNRIEAVRETRINLLVKAISEMKPSKAAEMLINMDRDMAVKILSQLKSNQIASILSAMPPEKAASISEALTGYPSKE